MGPAMLVVDTDDSTIMANIGRSLSRSYSPSTDVTVHLSLCDGTPSQSTVWRWWSSTASSRGSQRAWIMFLYHMGVCGTAGGAPIGVSRKLVFATHVYMSAAGNGLSLLAVVSNSELSVRRGPIVRRDSSDVVTARLFRR